MEDQENKDIVSESERKRQEYEEDLKQKIMSERKLNESNLREIDLQYKKISNLPKYEKNELMRKVYYWYMTGACYFFIGFFLLRRPRRLWKRIFIWVPSLLIMEVYITSHYFWSVKDKEEIKENNQIKSEENIYNDIINNDTTRDNEKLEADKLQH